MIISSFVTLTTLAGTISSSDRVVTFLRAEMSSTAGLGKCDILRFVVKLINISPRNHHAIYLEMG